MAMPNIRVWSVVALMSGVIVTAANAVEEKRGYWWKKEQAPAAESEQTNDDVYGDLAAPPTEEKLDGLHPRKIEKLINDYRAYAAWKPTPEHVGWYFQLQDYARRKAVAFMNTTEYVMLNRPDLNVNTQYPTTVPGTEARVRTRETNIRQRLESARDSAALVLLTRKTCAFCETQKTVLKYFQEQHGWAIREVDVDERPDLASRFGTDYTPTTLVIFKDSTEWMPVAVGVESVPGVEDGVYRALRMMSGDTTPQQYTLQEEEDGGVFDPNRVRRKQ